MGRRSPAGAPRPHPPARAGKGLVRALVRVGTGATRRHGAPRRPPPDGMVCLRCGAVFLRKTWRRSRRRLLEAAARSAPIGRCPACRSVAGAELPGRLRLEGAYVGLHEAELRRRIANVAARAAFTQPQRRVVAIAAQGPALEVTTTSQELAHRIACELCKAFGGSAVYHWSEHGARLRARWRRD
jgi:hypothetical protein